MNLSDEYRNQLAWRSWSSVMDLLPAVDGQLVLDLGCGVGDQAFELAARGASVIGIDANEELLATARAKSSATYWAGGARRAEYSSLLRS